MSFKEDLAKAKAKREPVVVDILLGDALYGVEVRRLDGMQWAEVIASAPPTTEAGARLAYDTAKGALIACERFGRLVYGDGKPVKDFVWQEVFETISGIEVTAIAATWWQMNMGEPNESVTAAKKAQLAASAT
jgi:hypothetical protein